MREYIDNFGQILNVKKVAALYSMSEEKFTINLGVSGFFLQNEQQNRR